MNTQVTFISCSDMTDDALERRVNQALNDIHQRGRVVRTIRHQTVSYSFPEDRGEPRICTTVLITHATRKK